MKIDRYITIVALAVFVLMNIVFIGILTNWFRYTLSLETTIIIIPLLTFAAVVIPLQIVSLKKKWKSWITLSLSALSIAGAVFLFDLLFKSTFGVLPSLSNISRDDIGTSTPRTLSTPKGERTYHIELWNTFSSSHTEYLLINRSGTHRRITIPLFKEEVHGGYSSPEDPAEWAILTPTKREDIYELNVHISQGAKFYIDIKNDEVVEKSN